MEAAVVSGQSFDVDAFGALTDRLGRCFARLGLERKARETGHTIDSVVSAIAKKRSAADG